MKKNKAAIDALITAGSTAITKKYKAIGKPAKVPNPFAAPATVPTKNLDKLWFSFLFLYPLSSNIAKNITVIEITMCINLGSKIESNFTPNGVPKVTPKSKYITNFQLILFHMLGIIKKLAITSNKRIIGTISTGGRIKDNKEILDAENPNPLNPLTNEANSITTQKKIKYPIVKLIFSKNSINNHNHSIILYINLIKIK